MKINPMHSVNAYQKQQEVARKEKANLSQKRDELQISSAAKQMQESSKVSLERQEKIDQIKNQVENGTYKVNAQEVARKFYDFWSK